MATATNPQTGEQVILSGDQWLPVEKTATGPNGSKAYLAGGKWITEEGVNRPATVAAARAVQQDLAPSVNDRFSQRYNPEQGTGGYVLNETAKTFMGLIGIPEAAINAQSPLTPMGAMGAVARQLRPDWLSTDRISQALGINPVMKAPGPGTEFLTGAGLDVAQNLAFPGGTIPQKVISGATSYLGRRAGEAGGPAGELAGSFLGGVAGPALLTARGSAIKSIWDASRGSMDDFTKKLRDNPEFMSRVRADALNQLAKDLRENPDLYTQKFAEAQALEQAVPGLKLNLAQRFPAPSVIEAQRNVDASNMAQRNQAAALRESQQGVMRREMLESPNARAMAEGAIGDVAEGARTRVAGLSDEIANLSRQAELISERVSRRVDVEDLGERQLAIRGNLLNQARGQANRLMNVAATAAEREGAAFDGAPIVQRANELRAQPVWDNANFPAIFNQVEQWGADGGGALTFEAIRDMRQAVSKDIRGVLTSNSQNARTQLRNLLELQRSIDTVVNTSPFQQTREAYDAFNQYYRGEFAPRFLRGINLAAERTGARGEPLLPGEKVFAQYFKAGNATNMARYLRLYGDNPESMVAMRDAVIDRYAREVIDQNGAIRPEKHQQFLERYRDPLNVLSRQAPGVANDITDAGTAFEAVMARRVSAQDEVTRINSDSVLKLMRDEFGTQTPDAVVQSALSDPRKMRAILARMNDNQASGFVDFISDSLAKSFQKDGNIQADEIRKFLADQGRSRAYESAMTRAHGTDAAHDQMITLKAIADVAERLDVTPVPSIRPAAREKNILKDEMQKKIGLSYAVVGNMLRAVVRGQVSPEWAGIVLGGQAFATVRQNLMNEVYKEVINDPGTATRVLAMMRTSPESVSIGRQAQALLKRSPKIASFFLGLEHYPRLGAMAGANLAREQAEPQEQ